MLTFQRRECAAVVVKYPPLKTLTAYDIPQSGKEVPHRLYGWPIAEDHMLDYARRHRLVFKVIPYFRRIFGDNEQFNYGDVTDDQLADEELLRHLRRMSLFDVKLHFCHQAGSKGLRIGVPKSQEWKRMLVVWSTDDYEKVYNWYDDWAKTGKFIDDALNECLPEGCKRRTSLAWWSCENRLASGAFVRFERG